MNCDVFAMCMCLASASTRILLSSATAPSSPLLQKSLFISLSLYFLTPSDFPFFLIICILSFFLFLNGHHPLEDEEGTRWLHTPEANNNPTNYPPVHNTPGQLSSFADILPVTLSKTMTNLQGSKANAGILVEKLPALQVKSSGRFPSQISKTLAADSVANTEQMMFFFDWKDGKMCKEYISSRNLP